MAPLFQHLPESGAGTGQEPGVSVSPSVADVHGDRAAVDDLAADQQPGQRVADGGLDQPAQRPGAVRRVVAGVGQPGLAPRR